MKALEIKGLKKTFHSNFLIKKYQVLKGIDLEVEKGEIYGFLGPNGSGKTTTIKCVLGLLAADAGEVRIAGLPASALAARRRVGFLPENPYFYDYLTAREFLRFSAAICEVPAAEAESRIAALVHRVGLSGHEDKKLRKFSKGMIQRLGLAQALVNDPELLILDEPFSGLDPVGRKDMRLLILALREQGKTVFFSSHILQDMEMMVDRVGIILGGAIRRQGRLSELINRSTQYVEVACDGIGAKELAQIRPEFSSRDGFFLITLPDDNEVNLVVESIIHMGGRIVAVQPVKMTLEDIFFSEMASGAGGDNR